MKYAEQLLKRTETAARRASHVVVEEGDILRCGYYLEELHLATRGCWGGPRPRHGLGAGRGVGDDGVGAFDSVADQGNVDKFADSTVDVDA